MPTLPHPCLSPWKGALAGGLIVFAWDTVSRLVLPFHGKPVDAIAPFVCGIAAFFWTWILGKIPGLTMRDSALYGAMFGLCVGVLGRLPDPLYSLDAVIAWSIASVVIGRWCQASVCALPAR